MGVEIERKFLVNGEAWREAADAGRRCRQGYLCRAPQATTRVRVMGEQAFLTVKGRTRGLTRAEFEYEIPVADAEAMLLLCERLIEKTRYLVPIEGMTWEVDVFEGENAGLVLAEIELESEGQVFVQPEWAAKEVSGEDRYYNSQLAENPFSGWGV